MNRTPSDLIQRMIEGDRASFDDVIAWYAGDVLRLGYLLLKDADEAKDVLQETLIRLVRLVKEGKLRTGNGSIKGLLLTAARNLCIDRLKKRRHFFTIDSEDADTDIHLSHSRTPARAADENRFQTEFENALTRLTDLQRTVLVLHDLKGENNQAIADALDLTVNAVTTHLCRARRILRRLLAHYGGGI